MTDHPCHKCPNAKLCSDSLLACSEFYYTMVFIERKTMFTRNGQIKLAHLNVNREPTRKYYMKSFPDDPINKTQTELKL